MLAGAGAAGGASDGAGVVADTAGGSAGNVYLLSYGFNQDCTCFVCGTTAGFRVYRTSPVSEHCKRERSGKFQNRSVVLVAMLFRTNLFAMVTVSDDDPSSGGYNKVQIWDDQKQDFLGELRSRTEVRGIALRREVLAMVCEYAIYVYTLANLKIILHLTTSANSRGLCVLATKSDPWILCCPGQSTGAVRVQVGQDDRATHVFEAHQTGLAALAVNASGSLVATASEKGTVFKIFQSSDGQLLYRLRRSTRPASISCLTFRHDDRFLAAASSSSTVHIFKLDPATAPQPGDAPGDMSPTGASPALGPAQDPHTQPPGSDVFGEHRGVNPPLEQLATKLQNVVTHIASHGAKETVSEAVKGVMPNYFNDLRSFAKFRLPDVAARSGLPAVDARSKEARILGPQLAFHEREPRLSVLHYSGMIYECSFRPDHDPGAGTQECGFHGATTWFAVRPDFRLQGPSAEVQLVPGGAEDDPDAEEWQLL